MGRFWDTHDFTEFDQPGEPDVEMVVFAAQQETGALMAADAVRDAALDDDNGVVFPDVASELEALRELRVFELEGEA